ncbi:MAG: flagellin [Opitutae bacterium]|nr:flagellin [Opitutae bacterium]
MSIVINSNMTASHSALNMSRANDLLKKSMLRLSSGKRIISPSDDAGGLAVGMKLQSQLRRTAATKQNIQNGVSFLQMQDGALKVSGEILDRMAELKSFFNDVSKNALDRETYNHEFKELQAQLVELQSSKFNGVSLFAKTEPDNNPMKIITTEDGLTGKVELNRTGLFENLKSKYGADGELNSGSHGEYRQLVGNFTVDGGILDSSPGKTSRDYANGDVVYMKGVSLSDSGYFMALGDVKAGTKITDTAKATSNWIRLADKGGKGFAEAFPSAADYDSTTTKYNSRGEKVAYLKGDVVRVPAHWATPGSYIFLEAQADVPQGIALEKVFNDNHVGDNKFFNYVGQDRSNGATTGDKPTTEYVRANSNLVEPSIYTSGTNAAAAAALKSLMAYNTARNHTPGYVKVGSDVYVANSDWNVKSWTAGVSFKEGEVIFDENPGNANEHVKEISSKVKGIFTGAAATMNDYVLHQGQWFQASSNVTKSTVPVDPASVNKEVGTNAKDTAFVAGDKIKDGTDIYIAPSTVRGEFNAGDVQLGSYVRNSADGEWYQIEATQGAIANFAAAPWADTTFYNANDIIEYNGTYYKAAANIAGAAGVNTPPDTAGSGWSLVTDAADLGSIQANGWLAAGDLTAAAWVKSPWELEANPEDQADFATNVTAEYSDVTNTSHWSKTHFGALTGQTVSASYTRGDNISYQGKHYVYVSHLDSNDPTYVSPTDDGYTEFEDLLRLGAVRELSMYVDTIGGGGGAGLPDGVFYRANQSLDYVDRLPNSGTVRTSTIARRTDSPLPPGDEIYNSQDDQFYGGLNAGNDGIYGTMDDFYATTSDPAIAKSGSHVDADADNNKDLLDSNNKLQHFSVADFVDYIQSLANFRAVNGGPMSRLGYAEDMLEENEINLEAATSRIMDADMAAESTKLARQNVLVQASASMVSQANQMANVVLSLLQ